LATLDATRRKRRGHGSVRSCPLDFLAPTVLTVKSNAGIALATIFGNRENEPWARKCIACPRGRSISVDEPGVPQLCRSCWDRAGQCIRVGSCVVGTEVDTTAGTVQKIADANIDCDDGGDAWIPAVLLVAVRAWVDRKMQQRERTATRRF
jgi:hypothetical protein